MVVVVEEESLNLLEATRYSDLAYAGAIFLARVDAYHPAVPKREENQDQSHLPCSWTIVHVGYSRSSYL